MLLTLWAKLDNSHASVVDVMNLIRAKRVDSKILAALVYFIKLRTDGMVRINRNILKTHANEAHNL